MKRKSGMRTSTGSLVADIIIYTLMGLVGIITVWPFIYVFSMSVSDPSEAMKQSVWLYPKGFNLDAYERIAGNVYLWRSYLNTVVYVLSGTFLSCIMSVLGAYPLTRSRLYGRKLFAKYLLIPMYFSGGLIPYFIIVTKIGLYNNLLVMIIPGMVSIWNIILARTFFMTLPEALQESAFIDGANDLTILFRIIIPLSKPIMAVIALYTAIGIWNSWFNALLFLPDSKLHPIQLFLAKVLVFESPDTKIGGVNMAEKMKQFSTSLQLKYAVILFASVPIICTYPFLQKYFIKGTLIGSLKE